MKSVDDSTLIETALTNRRVVVLYGATWCSPCKALKPQLDKLAVDFPDFQFVYADIQDCQTMAARHMVRGVPTVVVLDPSLSGPMPLAGATATAPSVRAALRRLVNG